MKQNTAIRIPERVCTPSLCTVTLESSAVISAMRSNPGFRTAQLRMRRCWISIPIRHRCIAQETSRKIVRPESPVGDPIENSGGSRLQHKVMRDTYVQYVQLLTAM